MSIYEYIKQLDGRSPHFYQLCNTLLDDFILYFSVPQMTIVLYCIAFAALGCNFIGRNNGLVVKHRKTEAALTYSAVHRQQGTIQLLAAAKCLCIAD